MAHFSKIIRFFTTTAGVGALATLGDLAVLTFLVEILDFVPAWANLPALAVGAVVQFLGCRYLIFRAQAGSWSKQAAGFAATETLTLTLNAVVFHLLVTLTAAPYAALRIATTFAVFVLFSLPAWRLVFRKPHPEPSLR